MHQPDSSALHKSVSVCPQTRNLIYVFHWWAHILINTIFTPTTKWMLKIRKNRILISFFNKQAENKESKVLKVNIRFQLSFWLPWLWNVHWAQKRDSLEKETVSTAALFCHECSVTLPWRIRVSSGLWPKCGVGSNFGCSLLQEPLDRPNCLFHLDVSCFVNEPNYTEINVHKTD